MRVFARAPGTSWHWPTKNKHNECLHSYAKVFLVNYTMPKPLSLREIDQIRKLFLDVQYSYAQIYGSKTVFFSYPKGFKVYPKSAFLTGIHRNCVKLYLKGSFSYPTSENVFFHTSFLQSLLERVLFHTLTVFLYTSILGSPRPRPPPSLPRRAGVPLGLSEGSIQE